MKQIKAILDNGVAVMLHEGISDYYDLIVKLPLARVGRVNTFSFNKNEVTPTEIHEQLVTLERSIHTVAEDLRAQIEEGEDAS